MANIHELMQRANITRRQADHWTRLGLLQPVNAWCGPGNSRDWPSREVRIAEIMGRLTRAGVTPEAACRVARGDPLGPGITIIMNDSPKA